MATPDTPDTPATPDAHSSDPTAAVTAELEGLDELPVAEHVEVLDRVNATIAAELAALDEV